MKTEYVRKQDAVSAVEFGITLASAINIETGEWTELFQRENDELREAVERIKDIEPADVAPVIHGRWIDTDSHLGYFANCSVCGYQMDVHAERGYFKYCPNCGAKMDGEE